MASMLTTKEEGGSWIQGAILFVVFAVPGLLLFLFCLGRSFLAVVGPEFRTWFNILGAGAGLCVGSIAMLVGTRRWGQWLYLLVLFSVPLLFFGVLAVMSVFEMWRFTSPVLAAGVLSAILAGWGARRVDRHYRKGSSNRRMSPGV